MLRAQRYRWLIGLSLAAAGLLANAGAQAKTLNLWLQVASPAPACTSNPFTTASGYRMSGGSWVFDCGAEQSVSGQTSHVTSCSSSANGISVTVGNQNNKAVTGISTPWTDTVQNTYYCGNSAVLTGTAWGT